MFRSWEGERRVFADGRVIVQEVTEDEVFVSGAWVSAKVARCVQADCGCAVMRLADLYQCHVCGAIVCNRCAAKCMACSRTACALHAVGIVDQGRAILLCAACMDAMNTPKWLKLLKGWWKWIRG
jgi:hypothetical protein